LAGDPLSEMHHIAPYPLHLGVIRRFRWWVLCVPAWSSARREGSHRCRLSPGADACAACLHAFVSDRVASVARVVTDRWRGIAVWTSLDAPTNRAASARPVPVEKVPGKSCPPPAGSPHCPKGDCSAPMKARSNRPSYPNTSTSSCSVLIAAAPTAAACWPPGPPTRRRPRSRWGRLTVSWTSLPG
jgi:hypothetical protein